MADTTDVYILGVNESLSAAAVLLKNGGIVAAAAQERFSRIKNQSGFPHEAVTYCCRLAGISTARLDLVVLNYRDPYPHFTYDRAQERTDVAPGWLRKIRDVAPQLEYKFPIVSTMTDYGRSLYYQIFEPINQKKQTKEIADSLGVSPKNILRLDHHLAHAESVYWATNHPQRLLILTLDGAGDQLCATVSIAENGRLRRIAATEHRFSPGLFYAAVTGYLGLKAHEDEYKVMGLAPYASGAPLQKLLTIFTKLLWVDGLQFRSIIPSRQYGLFLHEQLSGFRFDHIAAAAQLHFERIVLEWVTNAVTTTNIHNVSLSGGAFLNVKANMLLAQHKKINKIFVMPSPGDDSAAFGAAFWGARQMNVQPKPPTTLYLGPDFSGREIEEALSAFPKLTVNKPQHLTQTVAKLLNSGTIVARFSGKMEFGARALGNRSILADPRNPLIINQLNRAIKKRDFWMPFAATILAEKAKLYIYNPKKIPAAHMVMAFATTQLGQKHLAAALHPYDHTIRPQLLKHEDNPQYYELISEFGKRSGVWGLLNTSFNLHGEPIVCTPADALKTFMNCGLTHLIMNEWLICKS